MSMMDEAVFHIPIPSTFVGPIVRREFVHCREERLDLSNDQCRDQILALQIFPLHHEIFVTTLKICDVLFCTHNTMILFPSHTLLFLNRDTINNKTKVNVT